MTNEECQLAISQNKVIQLVPAITKEDRTLKELAGVLADACEEILSFRERVESMEKKKERKFSRKPATVR